MNQTINYIKLLKLFQGSNTDGSTYLLEDDIKEEVIALLKEHINNMLSSGDTWAFTDHIHIFDIDQIKIDLPDMFEHACKRLEILLGKSKIPALAFMIDLNDISQYDAFREFDDNMTPFEKYCMTIAEFWLDAFESLQEQYLIDRDKNAADLIATSYLESIYSPHTMLGRKRFDKERDALFN
tara:strand:- start:276 stop:821 length:546 start_codon:yes stop_codon:yes gene_type:complete